MKEEKEMLLMEIESTALWRTSLTERFPDDKHNLEAASDLLRLYDYVSTMNDVDLMFSLGVLGWDERSSEILNNELRVYGYQNTSEAPAEFITRIRKELIEQSLDDTRDN